MTLVSCYSRGMNCSCLMAEMDDVLNLVSHDMIWIYDEEFCCGLLWLQDITNQSNFPMLRRVS